MRLVKKAVVVGDSGCGKTCLLGTFDRNTFPEYFVSSYQYSKEIKVDEHTIELELNDTVTNGDYVRLRPLTYFKTHVVIMCFSIDCPTSLINIQEKWVPEIKQYLPNVPVILVGNKLDLRSDNGVESNPGNLKICQVTQEQGKEMAEKINAVTYMECSAKHLLGLGPIFEEAARVALFSKKRGKFGHCCTLL